MKRIVMTAVVMLALAAGTAWAQDAKVKKGMQVFATPEMFPVPLDSRQGKREGEDG